MSAGSFDSHETSLRNRAFVSKAIIKYMSGQQTPNREGRAPNAEGGRVWILTLNE